MKAHYDLIQGTSAWFELKYGRIGGSRAQSTFVDSDTLIYKLAAERSESYAWEDGYTSDAMLRGQDLEPVAIDRLSEYTGHTFIPCGWIDSDIENVGISPDGISPCETIMCEVKCPDGNKHIETCFSGKVPQDNIRQVLHYFVCNPKLETMYFVSFRPESLIKPLFVVELKRDSLIDVGLKKTIEVEVIGKKGVPIKPKTQSIPDLRTVNEWVALAKANLIAINERVDAVIEKIQF
jgi:hypothetical protein